MKVLFVGGTGNISTAAVKAVVRAGHDITVLNRGKTPSTLPADVASIQADISDVPAMKKILASNTFDVVVNWIVFNPEHAVRDIELFSGNCGQYVYISSTSVYHKPMNHFMTTESSPVGNTILSYAQSKLDCEELFVKAFRDSGFPITIVRPSHTYSDGRLLTCFGHDYTVPARILAGKPIVVHGDGTSLWTVTHAEDFAPPFVKLLGNPRTIGETYNLTSDEVLCWDQMHYMLGDVLGVKPVIVHMPSDFIARVSPGRGPWLLGDMTANVVFDNRKLKSVVGETPLEIPYYQGLQRSRQLLEEQPSLKIVNPDIDAEIEKLLQVWKKLD